MTRRALTGAGLIVALALPAALVAQGPGEITPLASHPASDELMAKIVAVLKDEAAVQKPALVFSSVVAGTPDQDGLAVMSAAFTEADGRNLANGRLILLLFDPAHLSSANVVTVRLVRPTTGGLTNLKFAFNTLGAEGQETVQAVLEPNADWTSGVMPVPLDKLPQGVADKLVAVGPVKIGAATSPRGFHVLIVREGGRAAFAFTVPKLADLQGHGVEWSDNAALR